MTEPAAVVELARRLSELGWVTDLWVAGSLATGDYRPGVSDVDLVAVTDGRVVPERTATLVEVHRDLDVGIAAGADVGCVYVAAEGLRDPALTHPTWTHGVLVRRVLSGITRAELVSRGKPLLGRPPAQVLPPFSRDDIRQAGREELCGYWSWAGRRPWFWLDPALADLALASMARARHTIQTGELMTKSEAIDEVRPEWLREQLRARRDGSAVRSPRWSTAWIAWRDIRRTCRSLCSPT